LRHTLLLTAGVAVLGALLTLVLPEPAGRSLDEISGADDVVAAAEFVLAETDPRAAIPESQRRLRPARTLRVTWPDG